MHDPESVELWGIRKIQEAHPALRKEKITPLSNEILYCWDVLESFVKAFHGMVWSKGFGSLIGRSGLQRSR